MSREYEEICLDWGGGAPDLALRLSSCDSQASFGRIFGPRQNSGASDRAQRNWADYSSRPPAKSRRDRKCELPATDVSEITPSQQRSTAPAQAVQDVNCRHLQQVLARWVRPLSLALVTAVTYLAGVVSLTSLSAPRLSVLYGRD